MPPLSLFRVDCIVDTAPHAHLPRFLDAKALERLTWRAAALDERIAACAGGPVRPADAAAAARLARWARLFAAGDAAALDTRLGWDGFTPQSIASALCDDPPPGGGWLAEWPRQLEALLQAASDMAAEFRDARWEREVDALGGAADLPFADVWLTLVRFARRPLETTAGRRLAPRALDAFARQLAVDLSRAGSLVLLEAFTALRRRSALRPDAGAGAYDEFVRHLLAGELRDLLLDFPALARRCVRLVEAWQETLRELVARLEADEGAIGRAFGRRPARVLAARPGLSDPHDGFRRVAVLEFEGNWKLLYKPRDLGLEAAFNDLLAWCRAAGLADVPAPLAMLDCGTHGWVEWVAASSLADRAEVAAYYRRAGGLLCLGYLLRSADLHAENIVAAGAGPALVDGEVMVQPVRPSEGGDPGEHEGAAEAQGIHATCLASGLLSLRHQDPRGGWFEAGGLRQAGRRRATVPRAMWHDLRADGIGFTPVEEYEPAAANVIRLGTEVQRPDDYARELGDGFRETYRFVLERRDALAGEGGPLARFRGRNARVLLRPSDTYGALLEVMNAPQHWRRGVDRSIAFESLNRPFGRQCEAPDLWPLARDEREALERGDVPRFTLATDATAPRAADGRPAAGHFSRAGYDAVLERLAAMSEEDLGRQVAWLEGALDVSQPGLDRAGGLTVEQGTSTAPPENLHLAAAVRLATDLLGPAATGSGGGLTWHVLGERLDLYGGYAGVGVFFAALARLQGEPWRTAARRVLATIDGLLACRAKSGRPAAACVPEASSLVYGLAVTGALLDEVGPRDRAAALASEVDEATLAAVRDYDVAGGLAGALLAFVALHEASGDPGSLRLARACARQVVARQEPIDGGRAWRAPDGYFRPGFGHGASGAAYALARFAAIGGGESNDALEAARAALGWEASMFSAADRNWPAIRRDGGASIMTGWCHGAAGIALGLALWPAALRDDRARRLLRQAIGATLAAAPARKDHPCCGTLARTEALLAAGQTSGDAGWREAASRLAAPVADRVRHFGLPEARTGGFEYRLLEPGFFQGVSGIGYGLLRLADPRLPSVAGFATPAWSA